MKRRTKKSKKDILQKVILICNRSKVYVNEEKFAKNTISHKCHYPFDVVVFIKGNI